MDQGYVTVLAQVWRPSPNDRWFLSKIIYCTVKIATPEELGWYTEDCLALKKEFPDLIAGSCASPLPHSQRAQIKHFCWQDSTWLVRKIPRNPLSTTSCLFFTSRSVKKSWASIYHSYSTPERLLAMVMPRTITCMMRFCWERRGLATGEILPSAPCPFVHASDLALGVGSKILDDQTSQAHGDM